ncbi:hypothetical protein HBA48_06940 [Kingella kingae]|nr:hypothetical protein [Kingella kingae]QIP51530.1 hypothetical protein HBA48_06940 [Kingella kingae]
MDGNSDHLQHKHEHGVAPPYPRFNSQQPNDTLSEYKKSSLHLIKMQAAFNTLL